jgi:3-hydroxybutyryl-CoA dehydrogenase
MTTESSSSIAVVGGGTMGSGIAQIAATAGFQVSLYDVGAAELDRAAAAIESSLARLARSGRLEPALAEETRARLSLTDDFAQALDGATIVIEAVPEILDLKHEVLGRIAAIAPKALIATNTSQFSITVLAAPLGEIAERFVGMHFFNPPVMMKLVEIIRGQRTSDATLDAAIEFARRLGKESVVCQKDSPGFITTRAYAALRLECLRILEEGVATAEDIDRALKLGFNLPMGPLELGDFNGLDISLRAFTALAEAHGDRFRPTVGLRNMVAAGKLGRKTGEGFYRYDADGSRIEP